MLTCILLCTLLLFPTRRESLDLEVEALLQISEVCVQGTILKPTAVKYILIIIVEIIAFGLAPKNLAMLTGINGAPMYRSTDPLPTLAAGLEYNVLGRSTRATIRCMQLNNYKKFERFFRFYSQCKLPECSCERYIYTAQ